VSALPSLVSRAIFHSLKIPLDCPVVNAENKAMKQTTDIAAKRTKGVKIDAEVHHQAALAARIARQFIGEWIEEAIRARLAKEAKRRA